MPTKEQIKQIKRVCGENYEETDIPTIIRNQEKNEIGIEIVITRNDEVIAQRTTESWQIAEQNLDSLRRQFA